MYNEETWLPQIEISKIGKQSAQAKTASCANMKLKT